MRGGRDDGAPAASCRERQVGWRGWGAKGQGRRRVAASLSPHAGRELLLGLDRGPSFACAQALVNPVCYTCISRGPARSTGWTRKSGSERISTGCALRAVNHARLPGAGWRPAAQPSRSRPTVRSCPAPPGCHVSAAAPCLPLPLATPPVGAHGAKPPRLGAGPAGATPRPSRQLQRVLACWRAAPHAPGSAGGGTGPLQQQAIWGALTAVVACPLAAAPAQAGVALSAQDKSPVY